MTMSRLNGGIRRSKTSARSSLFLRRSAVDVCASSRISYNTLDRPFCRGLAVHHGLATSHRPISRRLRTMKWAVATQVPISAFRRRLRRLLGEGLDRDRHQHLGQLQQWLASSPAASQEVGLRWRDVQKSPKQFISPALARRLGCKGRLGWRSIPTRRKTTQFLPRISSRPRCLPARGLSLHLISSMRHRIVQGRGGRIRATHRKIYQKHNGVGGLTDQALERLAALSDYKYRPVRTCKKSHHIFHIRKLCKMPFVPHFAHAGFCSVDNRTGVQSEIRTDIQDVVYGVRRILAQQTEGYRADMRRLTRPSNRGRSKADIQAIHG